MGEKEFLFLTLLVVCGVLAVSIPLHNSGNVSLDKEPELEGKGKSFVVYGDTRTGHPVHREVVSQIKSYSPEFVINTGDLVEDGSKKRLWRNFSAITNSLEGKYYPAVGNHEVWNGGGKDDFLNRFPRVPDKGYYSVKKAGVIFILVNQYLDYSPGSKQYRWFKKQLRGEGSLPRIVVMHEPHFKANHHANKKTARYLVPLMERYGVEAVFYGHSHMFGLARKNGIPYIVTGGGGAPLYGPNEGALDVSFQRHHFIVFAKERESLRARVVGKDGSIMFKFSILLT